MKTINTKELKELCCKDAVLVNVLPREGFATGRIPGSISVPLAEIEQLAPKVLPDKNQKIVVYCANKECTASTTAAKKLTTMGYMNVRDFEDGLAGYEHWKTVEKTDKGGCGCC